MLVPSAGPCAAGCCRIFAGRCFGGLSAGSASIDCRQLLIVCILPRLGQATMTGFPSGAGQPDDPARDVPPGQTLAERLASARIRRQKALAVRMPQGGEDDGILPRVRPWERPNKDAARADARGALSQSSDALILTARMRVDLDGPISAANGVADPRGPDPASCRNARARLAVHRKRRTKRQDAQA